MSAKITPELSVSRFLQLPREIRNLVFQYIYEELKGDDDKWAFDTLKVSCSWYNETMPVIVSNLHHIVMARFNSVWNIICSVGYLGLRLEAGAWIFRSALCAYIGLANAAFWHL